MRYLFIFFIFSVYGIETQMMSSDDFMDYKGYEYFEGFGDVEKVWIGEFTVLPSGKLLYNSNRGENKRDHIWEVDPNEGDHKPFIFKDKFADYYKVNRKNVYLLRGAMGERFFFRTDDLIQEGYNFGVVSSDGTNARSFAEAMPSKGFITTIIQANSGLVNFNFRSYDPPTKRGQVLMSFGRDPFFRDPNLTYYPVDRSGSNLRPFSADVQIEPGKFETRKWLDYISHRKNGAYYYSLRMDYGYEIRHMDEVFTGLNRVYKRRTTQSYDDIEPVELSDGRILFSTNRNLFTTNRSNPQAYELWIMNADGSNQQKLTTYKDGGIHENVSAMGAIELTPGKVVYKTDRSKADHYELWVLDLKTKESYPLTSYRGGYFKKVEYGSYFLRSGKAKSILPPLQRDFLDKIEKIAGYNIYSDKRESFVSIQDHASFLFSVDVLLKLTDSKTIKDSILPLFKQNILRPLNDIGIRSFSDLIKSKTQFKVFIAGLEALSLVGVVENQIAFKKVKSLSATFATELGMTGGKLSNFASALSEYDSFFVDLSSQEATKSVGAVLLTLLNHWKS